MSCSCCSINIKSNECKVHCDACHKPIHTKCIGLSENDLIITRSKSKSPKTICNSCDKNLAAFSGLKTLISDLRNELSSALDNLKTTLERLKNYNQ